MPRTIRDLMPMDLEFQMFVLDELADELIASGADVLKLTVGVPELPMPGPVLQTLVFFTDRRQSGAGGETKKGTKQSHRSTPAQLRTYDH